MLGRIALLPLRTGSELVAKSAARNLSTAGWGKERCRKSELESGALSGRAGADRNRRGRLR